MSIEDKKRELDKLLRDRLMFYRLIGEVSDRPLQEIYTYNEIVKLLMKIIEDIGRLEKKIDELIMILKTK